MKIATFMFFIGMLCTTNLVYAQAVDNASPWEFSIEGTYSYGSVSGYVQTPSGGEPGTSSSKRPRLSEIGIDNVSLYDARFTAGYQDESIVVDAEFVRMSGSDTLADSLISHSVTFPAGSRVSSDVQMDWYQVMYRHRFSFWRGTNTLPQLELYPAVGIAVFDFSYKLNGAGDLSASRSYIKLAPEICRRVEAISSWRRSSRWKRIGGRAAAASGWRCDLRERPRWRRRSRCYSWRN
jgi:hypothetical protein